MFVNYPDSALHVGNLDIEHAMHGLIVFWSHALAAAMFAALLVWRLGAHSQLGGQRLLLAGFAVTGCWAWLSAIGPLDALTGYAETARNLVWVSLLYSLSVRSDERQRGVRLVYAAVAAVLGFQLITDTVSLFMPSGAMTETGQV
ncbi:MAG TPA: hypothetical protein VF637_18115, partial [Sphingomicrobium sp.]